MYEFHNKYIVLSHCLVTGCYGLGVSKDLHKRCRVYFLSFFYPNSALVGRPSNVKQRFGRSWSLIVLKKCEMWPQDTTRL